MEWRILISALKPQVSLNFQPVFLKSTLEEQKEAERKASHLHLKILKNAIPCTLRNVLGPALLLPSGPWSLCTPLFLAFSCLSPSCCITPNKPTSALHIYLLFFCGIKKSKYSVCLTVLFQISLMVYNIIPLTMEFEIKEIFWVSVWNFWVLFFFHSLICT